MNKIFTIIFTILFIQAKGQDFTHQPDSVYKNHKVKRIYAYENSPKDMGAVIDIDTNGHKVKIVYYDASYDRKTRARKGISSISHYLYNSKNKLIEIIDSASYVHSSKETNREYFYYDNVGILKTSTYYTREFVDRETVYDYHPFRSTTTRRNDSLITYHITEEYDRDFYEKRSYGYYRESTLKTAKIVHGNDTSSYQYSDEKDLRRFEQFEEITNKFNSKGQLISADLNSCFMNDRYIAYLLTYQYYNNGLLKSVRGYIPEYFKYEFYN